MKVEKILRILLIVAGIYLFIDSMIHIMNLKLLSITDWPAPAIVYANLLNFLYGSFAFLAAMIAFILQKNLKKYKTLVLATAIWSFFHSFMLGFLIFNKDFVNEFAGMPSLYIWLPFYNQLLLFVAALLFLYGFLALFWIGSDKNE